MNQSLVKTASILIFCAIAMLMGMAQNTPSNLDSIINSLDLKEVVVTAKKISQREDTISYSAATYISKNDKSLEDLLAKMPGITISSNGQISFNGQWIKELYIEGLDMMGSNYGVTTHNLDAGAIAAVQVIQNHQDVKMLQGIEKGSAPAINIKLKNNAKGVWTSIISAAAGAHHSFAWDASASIINFSKTSQTIVVGKSNNTGNDLHREINAPRNFTSSYSTSLSAPSAPSLADRYAYDNLSHSMTLNRLWKISDDKTLTFNVNYLFDRENRNSLGITRYLTDSLEHYAVSELNSAQMKQHYVGANAVYKLNSKSRFLNNRFSVKAAFPDGSGIVNDIIPQDFSAHSLSLSDALKINYRRLGGGIGEASFNISFDNRKGNLYLPAMLLSQEIKQHYLKSNGNASILALRKPHIMFNVNAGYTGEWLSVKNFLSEESMHTYGNLDILTGTLFLTPRLMLHRGQRMQWVVTLPVGLRHYRSHSIINNYSKNFFYFRPNVSAFWNFNDLWSASLICVSEESMPQALDFMVDKHYSNYRTIYSNPEMVTSSPDRSVKGSLGADYKNVLGMIFASINATFAHLSLESSEAYVLDGATVNYFRIPENSWSEIWQIDQTFSKGFFRFNSKISQSLSLGQERIKSFVGTLPYKASTNFLSGRISFIASFTKWLSISTDNECRVTRTKTEGIRTDATRYSLTSMTSLTLSPDRPLSIIPAVTVYNNNFSTNYRTNVFLDCTAEYALHNVILSVKTTNLLDNRFFRRFTDNGIISRSMEYRLRGRTILFGIRLNL